MKIFVTGATGLIGTALIPELLQHGHQVLGLARSEEGAKKVQDAGAEILRGELEDYELLKKAASECDGVAHLGFIRDMARLKECSEIDRKAILEMVSVIKGTKKPFVGSFGTMLLPQDRIATERDKQPLDNQFGIRAETESILIEQVKDGVAAMAIRMPAIVHGRGDKRGISMFINFAKKHRRSAYVGDGSNAWAAVHAKDTARLFRLALENPVPGEVLHAVHEEGVPMKDIATAIGSYLKVPVESISLGEQANAHFGEYLAKVITTNNQVSSEYTRKLLNWTPKEQGTIADIDEGHYFV